MNNHRRKSFSVDEIRVNAIAQPKLSSNKGKIDGNAHGRNKRRKNV